MKCWVKSVVKKKKEKKKAIVKRHFLNFTYPTNHHK